MNPNNIVIKESDIVFAAIKRCNKIIGYLWISPFFITKEGYRQMFKKSVEEKYNVKIILKDINNLWPIKVNFNISYSIWKNDYPCIEHKSLGNILINNNQEFISLFNEYIKNEEIRIINIKLLLINDQILVNL